MILDGASRDIERLADLAIGGASRQQGQYFALPLGQLAEIVIGYQRLTLVAIVLLRDTTPPS
jgi:hypothetical protein